MCVVKHVWRQLNVAIPKYWRFSTQASKHWDVSWFITTLNISKAQYVASYIYIYIYIYTYIYIYIYICVCIYIYIYTQISLSLYLSLSLYIYIYMYTHILSSGRLPRLRRPRPRHLPRRPVAAPVGRPTSYCNQILLQSTLFMRGFYFSGVCEEVRCGQTGSTLMGPAAKVMNFDRLGKKVRPGTFGKIKLG